MLTSTKICTQILPGDFVPNYQGLVNRIDTEIDLVHFIS